MGLRFSGSGFRTLSLGFGVYGLGFGDVTPDSEMNGKEQETLN